MVSVVVAANLEAQPHAPAHPLPLRDILAGMLRADNADRQQIERYSSVRVYRIQNYRFKRAAEMTVNLTYKAPGQKEFHVVSETGAGILCQKVLRPMMDSEAAASGVGELGSNRITEKNYDFQFIRSDVDRGRPSYVLKVTPKHSSRYLMRGEIWVDAADFGISRIVGHPAKSFSFWVRDSQFVYEYSKIDSFWLPVTMVSEADSMLFGHTEVKVAYEQYRVKRTPLAESLAQ